MPDFSLSSPVFFTPRQGGQQPSPPFGQRLRTARKSGLAFSFLGFSLALALLLGVSGCDDQRIAELEEGVATEADVRARFGMPEKIWQASDMASVPQAGTAPAEPGARTLEYNRQPAGVVNYMITIGPDGRMSALRQVLTPQNFAKVQPGMPMETVRKLLGKPMKITRYDLSRETHYDWRYTNPPQQTKVFTAVFDPDLRVLRTGSVDAQVLDEAQHNR